MRSGRGVEPLIPGASPGGRPRKTDMRVPMNAILYLLRTGCPWRYLPREGFPPRFSTHPSGPPWPPRLIRDKMLNLSPESAQAWPQSALYPGNAG